MGRRVEISKTFDNRNENKRHAFDAAFKVINLAFTEGDTAAARQLGLTDDSEVVSISYMHLPCCKTFPAPYIFSPFYLYAFVYMKIFV